MKINQYKISLYNVLSPVDSEYILKIVKEQLIYLEKRGLIENSHVMISLENETKRSVHVDSNMIR